MTNIFKVSVYLLVALIVSSETYVYSLDPNPFSAEEVSENSLLLYREDVVKELGNKGRCSAYENVCEYGTIEDGIIVIMSTETSAAYPSIAIINVKFDPPISVMDFGIYFSRMNSDHVTFSQTAETRRQKIKNELEELSRSFYEN